MSLSNVIVVVYILSDNNDKYLYSSLAALLSARSYATHDTILTREK